MRYSLRFLFALLLVAAISAWIVMDRQKLRNEIESLNIAYEELQKANITLRLKAAEERLARQDTELETLKRNADKKHKGNNLDEESGRTQSLDRYLRSED